jgi:predicted RNase H-like nuclease (RuvC/YqgF family)
MVMIELGLLPLLLWMELLLVLLIVAVVLTLRNRALSRKLHDLQGRESGVIEAGGVSYSAYLRDELLKARALLEQHAGGEGAPAWLLARRRFLELELDAQAVAGDPMAFQEKLDGGFQALLDECRPAPEDNIEDKAEDVQLVEEPEPEPEAEEADVQQPVNARVSDDDLHKKEVMRLRDLIGHQQDAMRNLRTELESRSGEIDELETIVAQLDAFEKQMTELVRCIEVLEQENERLKQAREEGVVTGPGTSPEELNRLKEMVNDQHSTIGNLQTMLEQLRPEAGKAHDLEDMLNDVVKSNKELNTCIMVLEDENQSLRDQLNTQEKQGDTPGETDGADIAVFQQRIQELESLLEFKDATLEQLEQDIDRLRKEANTGDDSSGDDETLEIKVQELEALLEFKEAAIEELEKQYAELEAKYLELSGSEMPSN